MSSWFSRLFDSFHPSVEPLDDVTPEELPPLPTPRPADAPARQPDGVLSDTGIEYLKRLLALHEGKKLVVYKDTKGINTIGIGHNLRDKGVPDWIKAKAAAKGLNPYSRIDEEICTDFFLTDLNDAIEDCDKYFSWWRGLDEARKIAFIDLMFNMGPGTLLKFVNTMAAFKAGDFKRASQGLQNSAWFSQVGDRGPRIVGIVRTGKLPNV